VQRQRLVVAGKGDKGGGGGGWESPIFTEIWDPPLLKWLEEDYYFCDAPLPIPSLYPSKMYMKLGIVTKSSAKKHSLRVHHRPANISGFFGKKKNIKFSLPLPPSKHCTHYNCSLS
jgi:hypothetical protein